MPGKIRIRPLNLSYVYNHPDAHRQPATIYFKHAAIYLVIFPRDTFHDL
jgi:hypothetical protein